jgi:NADP-dependent 3-hydroxy acid dehydrogenase YdfG
VDQIISKHGRIDVLIQCAGVEGSLKRRGLEKQAEDWNKVIAVNLTGTFRGCKTVTPNMIAQKKGSVILLSSITSFMAKELGNSKISLQFRAETFNLTTHPAMHSLLTRLPPGTLTLCSPNQRNLICTQSCRQTRF